MLGLLESVCPIIQILVNKDFSSTREDLIYDHEFTIAKTAVFIIIQELYTFSQSSFINPLRLMFFIIIFFPKKSTVGGKWQSQDLGLKVSL